VDGLDVPDRVVSVTNGTSKLIGPFLPSVYNDGNGRVQINYSDITSVTVAVLRFSPTRNERSAVLRARRIKR